MFKSSFLARMLEFAARVEPYERRATILAFLFNFVLLGTYYILRPLRDTMGTVFGVARLQDLFTGTFVLIFLSAPFYAWAASRMKLNVFLPGVFWFLLANLLVFYALFHLAPHSKWLAGFFFCWFSAINLILVSVFWTFMADLFSAGQATRLYALIAAGGSTGAIAGPLITASLAVKVGIDGLFLIAIAGFSCVILLIHFLMREKERLRKIAADTQRTGLGHALPGNPFQGFTLLWRSGYMMGQAVFMLLMTWIATILYFMQSGLIARAYSVVEQRTIAFADVDLIVNICSALLLIFGLSAVFRRFGVTASLVLSPLLMVLACAGIMVAPTLFMVQAARSLQRISQYAIARPSREVLFTVVDQQSKYKAKNVIDTVIYRFGDLTAAWMQAGLRAGGFGLIGAVALGIGVSATWGFVAAGMGRRYEAIAGAKSGRVVAATP